ncbi:hypothetical protein F4560_000969 [Saccharothrix ecbatanensis]|uniref:Uncharacterized protein n=1 Tax=Saccharothrix ecbatanensis TaxID=1105145 RepID=A0A7W9HFW1_9PSEU|nr:hypothetical protein [Saccharothrix ecbatanensis]MBB5801201.1 hypothetical protein [Saccharothrix ecbatanensis]
METRSSPGGPAHQTSTGRNPLDDRLGGAVAVASVAVTLLELPIAAVIGSEAYATQTARSGEQTRTRYSAQAVLPVDAPGSLSGGTAIVASEVVEGAAVVAAAVAMGSWISLGGAMALGYVLVRSAQTRLRSLWKTEWAAVGPGWRTLA